MKKEEKELLKGDLKLFSTIILILLALFLSIIALWLVVDWISWLYPTYNRVA